MVGLQYCVKSLSNTAKWFLVLQTIFHYRLLTDIGCNLYAVYPYWLVYLMHIDLSLLIHAPSLSLPPSPSPLVTTRLFSVYRPSYISLSPSFHSHTHAGVDSIASQPCHALSTLEQDTGHWKGQPHSSIWPENQFHPHMKNAIFEVDSNNSYLD